MKAIVAVDNNWAIGNNNNLLISIPEDMKFFRETTINNTIIMGRKTLESFPENKPLKNRKNIILSHNINYKINNAIIVHSIEELKNKITNDNNIFIIGGESIYKQFINNCDIIYVTKILMEFKANKYFPNLDINNNFKIINESNIKEYNNIKYKFITYKNLNTINL